MQYATIMVFLLSLVLLTTFISADIGLLITVRRAGHNRGVAPCYRIIENICAVTRWAFLAFAAMVVALFLNKMLDIRIALFTTLPLFVCVYQIWYRYRFFPPASVCLAFSAALVYVLALTYYDKPDDLFGFGAINGIDLANRLQGTMAVVAGSPLVLALLSRGKDKAPLKSTPISVEQISFRENCRNILGRRRHGIVACAAMVGSFAMAELAIFWFNEFDGYSIPFRAYVALIAILFFVGGIIWQHSLSEEALLKAERAYLAYISVRLRPFNKQFANKKECLWEDYCLVFLNMCYSTKDVSSDKSNVDEAENMLRDTLRYRRDIQGRCSARDAAKFLSLYNREISQIDTIRRLLPILVDETDLRDPLDPFHFLTIFYSSLKDAAHWMDKPSRQPHNNISEEHIYTLAFACYCHRRFPAQIGAKSNGKDCPLRDICIKEHCSHECVPGNGNARIHLCNTLMTYPQRITEEMSSFVPGDTFDAHEYSQYYMTLFNAIDCQKLGEGFYQENMEEICLILGRLNDHNLATGVRRCLVELDNRQTAPWVGSLDDIRIRRRIAIAQNRYRHAEQFITDYKSANVLNDDVHVYFKMLMYIINPEDGGINNG